MKRILMMVLRNIILVPFMWCKLCYHAHHVDKYTEEEHYKMLKFIVRRANKGGNVTIAAEGLDNIPKENGFMFFPNHQGMYDVLAIMDVCPVPISVVAKKEVANIQFLKQVFACTKAYMIDREDVRQAMQVIMNVAKEVILFSRKELVRETEIKSEHLKVEVLKRQQRHVVQSFRWR